jgi:MYXO-CTERM domain-containing protein
VRQSILDAARAPAILAAMRLGHWLGVVIVALGVGSVSSPVGATGSSGGGGGGDTGDSGSCGTCQEPTPPVVFVSPLEGEQVAGDLTVTVEVSYACSCDDCGCYEDQPTSFSLSVDDADTPVFACADACAGTHVIELGLSPGTHQLIATAGYSFHSESATITVAVTGSAGTEGGATEGASEGSGSSGSGSSGGGKGGCRVGSGASPLGLGVGLLALVAMRRRRRRG